MEEQPRTYVRAIADLHSAHATTLDRALRVRGARVAAADAKAACRIAPLVARCGASIVPLFADPELVVITDQGLFDDRHALGALAGEVIQESELSAMVEAFEQVYRSRAFDDAFRRAKSRIAQDGAPATGRRVELPAERGRGLRTRSAAPRPALAAVTPAERELEAAARARTLRQVA